MEILKGKVEVRSLHKTKFGGLAQYPNTQGVVLTPRLGSSGSYLTGLSKEEEGELERLLNVTPGTLNARNVEFWAGIEIRIKNKTTLDLSNPMDYVKYKALLNDPKVCPSSMELNKYPSAEFVIYNEEAEASKEAAKVDVKIEAAEKFHELSEEEKREVLILFGKGSMRLASPNLIKTTLFRLMEENPRLFLNTLKDPNLKTLVFIEKLIEGGVLRKKGYDYIYGDDILGSGINSVVDYLNNPKNANVVVSLKTRLDKTGK